MEIKFKVGDKVVRKAYTKTSPFYIATITDITYTNNQLSYYFKGKGYDLEFSSFFYTDENKDEAKEYILLSSLC